MSADASPAGAAGLVGVAAEPGSAKPDPIVECDKLVRQFGGLRAVAVDHLEIQRGVITALIGPNGAGKTTLFNLLSGFDRADGGRCTFDGRPLHRLPAYRVARLGLVRTFQLTKALSRMTVMDNMKLGAPNQTGERFLGALARPRWREQERAAEERATELLARFNLAHMSGELAGTLSGGQRKLLEVARALMVRPAMVLLDEPMAGVNPALTQSLLEHVVALTEDGTTVLFVEHDMDVVMEISEWVVVMAAGSVIAEGSPAAIRSNPAVVDAYLGTRSARAGGGDAGGG